MSRDAENVLVVSLIGGLLLGYKPPSRQAVLIFDGAGLTAGELHEFGYS